MDTCFLTQVKRTNGTIEKGCVVKESLDAAKQAFHAYLAAYAYGHDETTDYVLVKITNWYGLDLGVEVWEKEQEQEAVNE